MGFVINESNVIFESGIGMGLKLMCIGANAISDRDRELTI